MIEDIRSACIRQARAIANDCGLPPMQALRTRSALNNDSNPFQIAVRCARTQTARVVVDPFAAEPDLRRRIDAAEQYARSSLRPLGEPALAAADAFLEATSLPIESTPHGQLWIALDAERHRVELYRPLAPSVDERRSVLRRLALLVGSGTCQRFAQEASAVSLSVSRSGEPLVSVYHRPRSAASQLFQWIAAPSYVAFFRILDPGRPLSQRGLLVACTYDSGGCRSVKVDLCAHCLAFSEAGWAHRFDELSHYFGIDLPLPTDDSTISFVGLSDGHGGPAVVVYYRPELFEHRSPAHAAHSTAS